MAVLDETPERQPSARLRAGLAPSLSHPRAAAALTETEGPATHWPRAGREGPSLVTAKGTEGPHIAPVRPGQARLGESHAVGAG